MSHKVERYLAWQKRIARFFLPYLKPDHTKLYLLSAFSLLMTATNAFLIWKLGTAVSQISGGEFAQLDNTLLMIAALALLSQVLRIAYAYVYQRLSLAFVDRLRGKMFEHIMEVSVPILQRFKKGDLMARLSSDVDRALTYVVNLPLNLFQNITVFVAYAVVLLWIDWKLSLIALTMAPFFFLSQLYVAPKSGEISRQFTKERVELASIEEQTLSNLRGISTFNSELFMRDTHKTQFDSARKWALKTREIQILYNSLFTALLYLAGVVVVYSGIAEIESGQLTIGALVSFLIYIRNITGPIRILARIPITLQSDRVAAERLMEILAMEPAVEDSESGRSLCVPHGDILFKDVSFTYPNQDRPVFSRLSVHIRAGESVALVGPSGAGKSTFAGLLLRFHDPQQGCICIDGVDIKSVSLRSLRNQISIVWQEPFLVNGSIRQNFYLAKPDATEAQMLDACKSSYAWEFVAGLEHGLDTVIGANGIELSAGQRQRLAIAQAFLRDTPLLILDEASSALDSRSEKMVTDALQALRKQRTTVIIAHRFSSIRSADRILYIDGKGCLTVGTHQELLAQHSEYKAAVDWQMAERPEDVG